jgi:predicted XRE-type DNA-binding protein
MSKEKSKIKKDCSNVFKDLGVANSNEEFMKARFAAIIRDIIVERGLEEDDAVETLGISKSEATSLLKGKFSDLSLDCLLSLLGKLGLHIEFVAREIPPGKSPKGLRISTSF